MDTIALDPRLRHATGFLGRKPVMLIDGKIGAGGVRQDFRGLQPGHRRR